MNDRELLELAAKAAGYDDLGSWDERLKAMWDGEGWHWNPLTDDGDALRLSVRLKLDVLYGPTVVVAERSKSGVFVFAEPFGNDPYAATRQAIVRAAAEIAKQQEPPR